MAKPSVAPTINGPFAHHVYIGCAIADQSRVEKLRRQLEQLQIKCCTRNVDGHVDRAMISIINSGVSSSRKCLLYVSPDYVADEWFDIETKAVQSKVNRFTRDMLLVLKDSRLPILPEQFRGFSCFVADESVDGDAEHANRIAAEILKGLLLACQNQFAHFLSSQ